MRTKTREELFQIKCNDEYCCHRNDHQWAREDVLRGRSFFRFKELKLMMHEISQEAERLRVEEVQS